MPIPKTKAEAQALLKKAAIDAGDYLDGVDDDNFDGEAFVERLKVHAAHDWVATLIGVVLVIGGWELFHFVLRALR